MKRVEYLYFFCMVLLLTVGAVWALSAAVEESHKKGVQEGFNMGLERGAEQAPEFDSPPPEPKFITRGCSVVGIDSRKIQPYDMKSRYVLPDMHYSFFVHVAADDPGAEMQLLTQALQVSDAKTHMALDPALIRLTEAGEHILEVVVPVGGGALVAGPANVRPRN